MSAQIKDDLITVIIPTFGRADFLLRSLKSVQIQTYNNIEIIIVDDNGKGSENQIFTQAKLLSFIESDNRIKYIVHEYNKNGSAARNTGIQNATGNYICFLDDDDEFEVEKIEKQYLRLKQLNENFGACYCGHKRVRDNQVISIYEPTEEGDILFLLLLHSIDACTGSTLMIERKVLDNVKGFDVSFKRHQDYEFVARVAYHTKIAVVSDPLVRIHMHSGSYSQKKYDDVMTTRYDYIKKMGLLYDKLSRNEIHRIEYNNNLIFAKTALKYRKLNDFAFYFLKAKSVRFLFDLLMDSSKYIRRKSRLK